MFVHENAFDLLKSPTSSLPLPHSPQPFVPYKWSCCCSRSSGCCWLQLRHPAPVIAALIAASPLPASPPCSWHHAASEANPRANTRSLGGSC